MTLSSVPPAPRGADWRPGRYGVLAILGAAALGLALFFWVTRQPPHERFLRSGEVPPVAAPSDYAPLPAPLPAGSERGASGMDRSAPPPARPRVAERARETPPPGTAAPGAAPRATVPPRPIASQSPPPRYPPQALRRGESGTVLVRVRVGADGTPEDVSIADSSGSRLLDRAALEAVRRWRFTPATANGRPVADTVQVPIDFRTER